MVDLSKGIDEICGRIEREKVAAGVIYSEMVGLKGVEGLLKWQEEK